MDRMLTHSNKIVALLLALELLAFAPALFAQEPPTETPPEPAVAEPDLETSPRPRRQRRESSRYTYNELTMIGQDVTVKEGEISRDVVVIGANAAIHGEVKGDLVVLGGMARLGPSANVRGDVVVIGGGLEADPAARVTGERIIMGLGGSFGGKPWLQPLGEWIRHGPLNGRPLPHQVPMSWAVAGLALLLYVVIAVLFPTLVQAPLTALEEKPGQALLAGLLGLVLTGPLLLLLTITVVGIPVIPVALAGLLAALIFGRVAVYRYAGQRLGAQFGVGALRKPLTAVIVGALLFCLLYTVPVLGLLVWAAVAPLSLGAVLLALLQRARAGVGPEPVNVTLNPSAAAPDSPPVPASLPRVGFWARLLATTLDFVFVGLLVALLRQPKLFLPFWIAYHLAFWAWNGTTLGGIVLGLKIVRTDGLPINFAIALVRVLGSFFSVAVLGLGFFWAGWSADRQSWHDKIAGTVVVKFPKGVSLVS